MIISKVRHKKRVKYDASYGTAIFRQEPTRRLITLDSAWDDMWGSGGVSRYFLSLPYVFFAINYKIRRKKIKDKCITRYRAASLNVCFATEPNLEKGYVAAFPNIFSGNEVCIDLPFEDFKTIDELVKCSVDAFWASGFDPGEIASPYEGSPKLLSDLDDWQNKTKKNPLWIPKERDMLKIRKLSSDFDFKRKKVAKKTLQKKKSVVE